ncbi:MAG: MFS transporter [Candidatus Acidulodesulfobacterium acidiphilum]|uniref:MFS transporter n=1 Tax=Candidatus Acidulodesulfobacterium acidiphilum TaxID=2597224 RepID=A0A520XCI3_9DELT|nr:MAG: MFS transporter [Candidatus Acidulodesulfobacterium acidiphilum]
MPAIIFVFLVILLQRANTNLIQSINPLFVRYVLDKNLFYVGITTAVYALSTLSVRYLVSIRIKPQAVSKFVIAGLILFSAAILGYFFSTDYAEFLIFVVISGFATAIIMPFLLSLVHLVSDKSEIEKNLTIYSLMLSLALVFGPLLSSALLTVLPIRWIYIMLSIFGITAFLFALKIHLKSKSVIKEKLGEKPDVQDLNKNSQKSAKSGSISSLFKNRGFLEVIFYNTSFSIAFASVVALGGVFARNNFHLKYFEITLLFSLFFISSLITRLILLYFTKKANIKNKTKILNISILISVLSFALMVFSKNIGFYAFALIIFGIPHALIFPIGTMRISETVDMKDMVAANTIYQSNFDLGGIIGPFFLSYIAGIYSIRFVFGIITVFLIAVFAAGKYIKQ